MKLLHIIVFVIVAATKSAELIAANEIAPLDPARVTSIAALLADYPTGLGPTIDDRETWNRIALEKAGKAKLWNANKMLDQEFPKSTDELYLEFSKTGNRSNWEAVHRKQLSMLNAFVLSECLENKGRFLPRLEELLAEFCGARTWVWPAHDGNLENFNGTTTDIDLTTATLGWELSTADHLLGEKLKPEIRKLLRENLQRRILDPFRAMFSGKRKPKQWMYTPSNWTAVSTAGITGTALALIDDRTIRAEYIAAAEQYSRVYLSSFTSDGCCVEGVGYWVYGFWHYVALAESIRQATGNGVNLMAQPEARRCAGYGKRIQIMNGIWPAYGDCDVTDGSPKGFDLVQSYIDRFYTGKQSAAPDLEDSLCGTLVGAMLCWFPSNTLPALPADAAEQNESPLRSWFHESGLLVSRPAPGSECKFSVALKGGVNDGPHTHRDLGSFIAVVGNVQVILDPGREVYSASSFGAKRFDCKLTNSFGHSAPIVAGQLQCGGKDACAKVVRTEFADSNDTLVLDLRSAYTVKELQTLQRTFVYSREAAGSLQVIDEVAFEKPLTYQTALITRGSCLKQEDRSLLIRDGASALRVDIDTSGADWKLLTEEIRENAPVKPTHIGIELVAPTMRAKVALKITPVNP